MDATCPQLIARRNCRCVLAHRSISYRIQPESCNNLGAFLAIFGSRHLRLATPERSEMGQHKILPRHLEPTQWTPKHAERHYTWKITRNCSSIRPFAVTVSEKWSSFHVHEVHERCKSAGSGRSEKPIPSETPSLSTNNAALIRSMPPIVPPCTIECRISDQLTKSGIRSGVMTALLFK
jgi:hypothetical protein